MFELYDECPFDVLWQESRLLAARKLSEADIPCMIYAEDALAHAHFVPTYQFGLHIVPLSLLVHSTSSHIPADESTIRPFFLPNADLKPKIAELKSSLRPENQPAFDQTLRDKFSVRKAFDLRREVFRQMGRLDLANRPAPTSPPGNDALIERLKAKAAKASETKGPDESVSQ
ncbi:hypothetical protein D9613_008092 [Agrocybe pediades]|uniref:Uncharacterized protein n=1 Tax=Agrocybe pediades TaxID=84607 RepID=A0A8H4VK53_9AGAR|nr:hypothetical protein D9613_008092 [Agrocybe pediades]